MATTQLKDPPISKRLAKNIKRNFIERVIEIILMFAALAATFITLGIVYILVTEASGFFKEVSIIEFLTSRQWSPLFEDAHYGILPLVSGTLTTSFIALSIAIPIGTIAAIYLSEFASHKTR
ncbi:MAG: phosphate ABC transporter permease subunit PstC, partial [Candidatus Methylopumilus sp.]